MTLKIYANVDISELSWAIPNMFFDFNNQDYKIDVTPQNVIYDINVVAGGTECILSSTDLHKFNNDVKSK